MGERRLRAHPYLSIGVGVNEAVSNAGPALRQEGLFLAFGLSHVVPPVRDLNDTSLIEKMIDQGFKVPILRKDDCDVNGACKDEVKTVKRERDIHT